MRKLFWKRLALSFASFFILLLCIEGAFRLFVPRPAPVHLRDGVYMNTLGKVDGFDTRLLVQGAPLPAKKRPGEIRIAVFGESTVQGAPWDGYGAPPTMLYDHLKRELPDRDLTVINMGRGSGFSMDAYYFLVSLKSFGLDYVVIYEGANDEYKVDREMCLPSTHPTLHRAWRWLVEHSRFAWTVRAKGPPWLVRLRGGMKGPHVVPRVADRCDPEAGFKAWTDLLIETAQSWGAKVVVATAVSNPLRWAERDGQFGVDAPLRLDQRDDGYRTLLGCMLTRGCDIAATWTKVQSTPDGLIGLFKGVRYPPIVWLLPRVRISLDSAAEHGARGIDFHGYITKYANGGLDPALFVDEMHLTLEGEWLLSWFWAREIASLVDGRDRPLLPPKLDPQTYLPSIVKDQRRGVPCIYFSTVPVFLRANMPLVASVQLRLALAADPGSAAGGLARTRAGLNAQLVNGWLRQQLGLDPQLPPALAAHLGEVSVQALAKEGQEQRDCSTMGGPALEPLVTDKTGGYVPPPAPPRLATDGKSTRPAVVGWVVPRGRDEAITKMLDGIRPQGCTLDDIAPDGQMIHLRYVCATGNIGVDLCHPSRGEGALARTERFAVMAGARRPPEGFAAELAAALRKTESGFQWVDSKDAPQ